MQKATTLLLRPSKVQRPLPFWHLFPTATTNNPTHASRQRNIDQTWNIEQGISNDEVCSKRGCTLAINGNKKLGIWHCTSRPTIHHSLFSVRYSVFYLRLHHSLFEVQLLSTFFVRLLYSMSCKFFLAVSILFTNIEISSCNSDKAFTVD